MGNEEELMKVDLRPETVDQRSDIKRAISSRRRFLQHSLVGATLVVPVFVACGTGGNGQTVLGKNVIATATVDATTTVGSTPTTDVTPTEGISTPTVGATVPGSSTTPTVSSTTVPITQISNASKAFNEILQDETQHVKFLQDTLKKAGATARPKPTFKGLQQTSVESFAQLSQTLENVGVGAYLMATPAIASKTYLEAAASILTIESRHAGFVGGLLGAPLSPNGAFDKAMTQDEIVSAITPYIENLNGGADPAGKLVNDVDVLNFALLLEYLEDEFYSTNVPKLFKA